MRTALITGANRGLGLEFTRQLLAQGLQVIACSRAPAGELAALVDEHPQRLQSLPLDVADAAAIAALPARLTTAGVRHLDVLINNAGVLVSGERYGSLRAEDLACSFAINASAPMLLTEALTALLMQGHAARVLLRFKESSQHRLVGPRIVVRRAPRLAFSIPAFCGVCG